MAITQEEKKYKYLLGARNLSESEIEKVLPTYNMVFSQINMIRNSFILDDIKESNSIVRKTNSLGIMGKRGTGKTSILYSIQARLKKEHDEDIILPFIVPENMSDRSDLMGIIIGMFNNAIDEIECDAKKENYKEANNDFYDKTNCRFKKDNSLREAYKNLLAAYCYIQPEYRDLLIRNYSDLPTYLDKSSEVFNADTEFRKKFDDFIYQLVSIRSKQKDNKKALVHIFIDDIDLAPQRCPQIARALLAYLAHPAIVVHISGDIETFEEALAIEFLTHGNQLIQRDILDEAFVGDKKLIDRKKELAYDYLKKIIPANYRQSLQNWDLKSRAEYSIDRCREEKGKNELEDESVAKDNRYGENKIETLQELLIKVLKEECVGTLFTAYKYDGENLSEKKEALSLGYHIFDERSRGLNNVYVALLQMKEEQNQESIFKLKKMLVETIITATPYLNDQRDIIEKIILWGETEQSTNIRTDNLKEQIYSISLIEERGKLREKVYSITRGEDAIRQYTLFELIYFVIRILPKVNYDVASFQEAKKETLFILLVNPILHGSTLEINFDTVIWWANILNINSGIHIEVEKDTRKWEPYIKNFIIENDFDFALHYYEQMIKEIGYIFDEEHITREQFVITFIKSLETYAGDKQRNILEEWWSCEDKMSILNKLYIDSLTSEDSIVYKNLFTQLEVRVKGIFKEYVVGTIDSINQQTIETYFSPIEVDETKKKGQIKRYKEDSEKGCFITIYRKQIKTISFNEIFEILYENFIELFREVLEYDFKDIKIETIKEDKADVIEKKDDIKLLEICCREKMWDKVWLPRLIEKNIQEIILIHKRVLNKQKDTNAGERIFKEKLVFKIKEKLKDSLIEFFDSFDGVSETVSAITKDRVRNILESACKNNGLDIDSENLLFNRKTEEMINLVQSFTLEQYLDLIVWIEGLANNYQVTYGRGEATKVLANLRRLVPTFIGQDIERDELKVRLLYYILYLRQTRSDIDKVLTIAKTITELNDRLGKSQTKSEKTIEDEIKELLGKPKIDLAKILG